MNYIEEKDYKFLLEADFKLKLEKLAAECLIKMEIFNDKHQEKYDRTIYFEVFFNDLDKINDCLSQIRKFHFQFGKSFITEIIKKD